MGVVTKIISLSFIALGTLIVITYGGAQDPVISFIGMFAGLMLWSIGLALMGAGRTTQVKPPPPTITEIRCDNPDCDFKEIRDFEPGDYILRPMEAHCPKCQGSLTIYGIYVVLEQEEKSTI